MKENTEYISISHWGMFSTDPEDYVPYNFMEKYLK